MKGLSKAACKVVDKLVSQAGIEGHVKINNSDGAFMPVIVERIGQNVDFLGTVVDIYSVSHYYEQNGDLVPDPDVTLAVKQEKEGTLAYPLTIQNSFRYEEAMFVNNGDWLYRKKSYNDLVKFCNMWMKNIKYQQSL